MPIVNNLEEVISGLDLSVSTVARHAGLSYGTVQRAAIGRVVQEYSIEKIIHFLNDVAANSSEPKRVFLRRLDFEHYDVVMGAHLQSDDETLKFNLEAMTLYLQLPESRIGERWVASGESFSIDPSGDETDQKAALLPIVQQLHVGLKEKLSKLEPQILRLNNLTGWEGAYNSVKRLRNAIDCETREIPERLGTIYNASIEVASYLEQNNAIKSGNRSHADVLDVSIERALSDSVLTFAPWIRFFPSIRQIDDAAQSFEVNPNEAKDRDQIFDNARKLDLITQSAVETLVLLDIAAQHGNIQGNKAAARKTVTGRRFIIAVCSLVMTTYIGAIGSDLSLHSSLVKKASALIAQGEEAIEGVASNLPTDVKSAIGEMIRRLQASPTPDQ